MKLETSDRPDVETLAATIAQSPIIVTESVVTQELNLPAGFDQVDVAILRWIAADSRRAQPSYQS